MEKFIKLLVFAKHCYDKFDDSHGIKHGIDVMTNVYKIVLNLDNSIDDQDFNEIIVAGLIHDVRDHKYLDKCISEEELDKFLYSYFSEEKNSQNHDSANTVKHIINNISWSKEVKGLNKPLETKDWKRKIVQEADWIEALGENGLKRCIDYGIYAGLSIPSDVCKHINEKLLIIPSKLTFKYTLNVSKNLIKPLNDYLEKEGLD